MSTPSQRETPCREFVEDETFPYLIRCVCGRCRDQYPAAPLAPSEAGGREVFNEQSLRAEIVRVWGPAGAHVDVFDTLLARLASRPSGEDSARLREAIADYGWRYDGAVTFSVNLTSVGEAKRLSHLFDRSSEEDSARERIDAQRYRFLRDNPLGLRAVDGNAKYPPPTAEQFDRYVDHAREDAAIVAEAAAEIRAARASEGSPS